MKKILLIIFFISLTSNLFAGNITVTSGSSDNLKVTDGDTIVINGKKIRFSGIDTPEINQTCIKNFKIEECGVIAKNLLIKKIGKSKVECVEEGKDYFNRVLAECFIEDESLSKYLVRNGYAFAFKKYSKKFKFWREKLLNIVKSPITELNKNMILTIRPLSSFKKRKVENIPSIFKLNNNVITQPKMKNVCQKVSLSIRGKLKFKLFIKRALNINWNSIDKERKISGIKDFKIIESIQ